MDTSLVNLLTAYELASHNLDVSLFRLQAILQVYNETEVNPTLFLTCLSQVQTVKEQLCMVEKWLQKQVEKEPHSNE